MRFLLDTNVLSEGAKPEPGPGLAGWLQGQSTLDLCVSVLTLGEIRKGILLMSDGRQRDRLHDWLRADLTRRFQGRILPIDDAVALAWGGLAAEGQAAGRRLPVIDGLMLATAAVHHLVFVTRNEGDCAGRGVPVLNPWEG
jgi:toxin FitB